MANAMSGHLHLKWRDCFSHVLTPWPKQRVSPTGIAFDLADLKYEYPHEPVPDGWTADDWLAHLVWRAAHKRHGENIPEKLRKLVQKELDFIRDHKFAYYFLTVHDLVKFARDQKPPILCQGRGSAANSAVCFLLGCDVGRSDEA